MLSFIQKILARESAPVLPAEPQREKSNETQTQTPGDQSTYLSPSEQLKFEPIPEKMKGCATNPQFGSNNQLEESMRNQTVNPSLLQYLLTGICETGILGEGICQLWQTTAIEHLEANIPEIECRVEKIRGEIGVICEPEK